MRNPDESLELVRTRVRAGDLSGAREIDIPGRHGQRGALSIALAERRPDDAVTIATALADSGWWDPEVAATIVEYGGPDHLVLRAQSIVSTITVARMRTIEEIVAMVRDALAAGAVLEAFLAAEEAIGRWPDHAELWAVVALTRSETGDGSGAREAIRRASARDAGNPFVTLVEAYIDAATGAAHEARVREAIASGIDPEFADQFARVVEVGAVWGAVVAAAPRSV